MVACFRPQQASSAILLAARDFDVALPTKPRPWWQVFLGDQQHKVQELVDVANSILGLSSLQKSGSMMGKISTSQKDVENDGHFVDWMVASYGFVKSLVKGTGDEAAAATTFNDPNSFLWEYQREVLEKELGKDL